MSFAQITLKTLNSPILTEGTDSSRSSSSYIIQHPQSSSTVLKSATSSQRKNSGCHRRRNVNSFPFPFPHSQLVSPSPVSPTHQERMLKLKKKIESQRKSIKRIRLSPAAACKQVKELATIKSFSAKYLRADVHDLFCTQLDMSVKKKKK